MRRRLGTDLRQQAPDLCAGRGVLGDLPQELRGVAPLLDQLAEGSSILH